MSESSQKSKDLILFIFGCIGSLLLHSVSLVVSSRGTYCCGARASPCGGFSCCEVRALGAWDSVVVSCRLNSCCLQALEHRLSSCGTRA